MLAGLIAWTRLTDAVQSFKASGDERRRRRLHDRHQRLLDAELPRALANGEIYVVYQPKLDLREGRYDGVEALLRWQHPSLGAVDPGTVIETAEATGRIHALSLWILERAIRDQRALVDSHGLLRFHINLSGKSLAKDDFIDRVCELVQGAASAIGLEITETAFIANPAAAMANLHRLAAAGISLSIDDYGSGHSSLAYLKELPANEIKIDRLFVSGMTRSHRDPLIVRSTIDLAHALGMRVVAEGVESQAALALLRVMGCDVAQGFFISAALRLEDLVLFLDNEEHRRRLNDTNISLSPSRAFWARAGRERSEDAIDAAPSPD